MGIRKLFLAFFILSLLGVGLTIAGDGIKPAFKPSEKAYYLTDAQASFVRPGLNLTIQKVEYAPPTVKVTFQITDSAGQGLDRLGIQTPGPVSTSFVLARIKPGDTQYTNYFTNHVTALPAPGCANCTVGNSTDQPVGDSGGTYADLGNGVYTYTFGKQLPANFEANNTNTPARSPGSDDLPEARRGVAGVPALLRARDRRVPARAAARRRARIRGARRGHRASAPRPRRRGARARPGHLPRRLGGRSRCLPSAALSRAVPGCAPSRSPALFSSARASR